MGDVAAFDYEARKERVATARRDLLSAAKAYAGACDANNYPALSVLARELKEASRRYRWAIVGIVGDPRRKA